MSLRNSVLIIFVILIIDQISKIYINHDLDEKFFVNLYHTSIKLNRHDIAEQISIAIKRSKYIKKLDMFSKLPFFWLPAQALSKHLLRDSPN